MGRDLTTSECSKLCGFSVSKIYKLTMNREIPHKKIFGRLRFEEKKLIKWLEEQSIEILTKDELETKARKL